LDFIIKIRIYLVNNKPNKERKKPEIFTFESVVDFVAALAWARVVAPRGCGLLVPGGLDRVVEGPDTARRRAASERLLEAEVVVVVESSL
jgi:hypothetical protein